MTHDVQTIREDLAFMRALAQEGRHAPLLVGHGLLSAGIVFSAASVFAWTVETRVLAAPPIWEGLIWPLALVVFVAYARWRRQVCGADKPGATAVTNRAVRAAMQGLGYALLSLLFGSWALAYVMHSTAVFAMFPPVVLAIYGAAWWVAAAMSELRWIRWVGVACFLLAVLTGFTTATVYGYLAFAAALLAVTSVPGWMLIRMEPSRVV